MRVIIKAAYIWRDNGLKHNIRDSLYTHIRKKRIKRMQKSAQTHGTQRDSLVDKLRETLIITDWVRLYFFLPTLQHDTYKNIPKKTERRMNMKVRKCGTMRSCCLRRASIFGHPTMMHT